MRVKMRFGGIFELDKKLEELEEINLELADPAIWQNPERAQTLGKEKARLENITESISIIEKGIRDAEELITLAREEKDLSLLEIIAVDVDKITKIIADLEFKRMFSG